MKNFIYKLKDDTGKAIYGFSAVKDKEELRRRLRKNNYFFISACLYSREKIFRKKISLDALLMFTRRLSSLIEAGVPILTAVSILWRQTEDKTLQLVISHIRVQLEEGNSISQALEDFPLIFSTMYCAMIAVAEKSGALVDVLKKLTQYLEYQKETITRTKKVMLYPTIVMIFTVLILVFMFTFVVPTFHKVLLKLNVELPVLTKVVLVISAAMRSRQFLSGLAAVAAAGYFLYRKLRQSPEFSYKVDYYKLRLPVCGEIIYANTVSRLIHVLGMLLGAGVPVVESFEVAKATVSNKHMERNVDRVKKSIEKGGAMYESFKQTNAFPVLLIEMIGVGESSGSMVEVLERLARHFDEEVEYKQNKVFTIIEPLLILAVGVIVIFTLLAVYLPIFSIWQGLLG
jgi:type II secretory pathway component PulF